VGKLRLSDAKNYLKAVREGNRAESGSFDILISQCSSGVEQRFCKPPVVGSNPATGSVQPLKMGGYQSGQLGQTVNLLA
tara:strand:- start:363 stop:599 length:237 start_codon:yes stop_codon:yes gene_type:complete